MKYSEELKNSMLELIDRYGITLVEVPDRFKEKLVDAIGTDHQEEINHAFKTLENGAIRNLRICAAQKIEPEKLAEAKRLVKQIEGVSDEDAHENLNLWLGVLKIRSDQPIDALDDEAFFIRSGSSESLEDFAQIIDNTSITAPLDVERVVNQFDRESTVPEPQVKDFDGNFSDTSFETVADFSISEDEKEFINQLQTTSPVTFTQKNEESSKPKNKRQKSKNSLKVSSQEDARVLYEPPGSEKQTTKETIEGAFKALRDGNPSLASRIMMELARNGDTRAQFHLAEFYLQGTGIEKSDEKAKYWLRKAANQGSVPAKSKLEEIGNQENSGGCCGCFLTVFVIFVILKLLGSLI
ncbi:MAG: hypothetical protein Kow0029_15840 [Candidatus Rifleibacteriota bacterium]